MKQAAQHCLQNVTDFNVIEVTDKSESPMEYFTPRQLAINVFQADTKVKGTNRTDSPSLVSILSQLYQVATRT